MNGFASYLQYVHTVAIIGHIRPDGDCIGSCMATYNYIDTFWPDIKADVYLEPIPSIFKFLQNTNKISSKYDPEKTYDLCIIQDCGSLDRIGAAVGIFQTAGKTICIDHHISNNNFADVNHIFPNISSTSELIFEMIGKESITKEIAECIYVGIVHDTGVFQYSSTTAKTMNIAGCLMETGIDFSKIVDETFYRKSMKQNKMLAHVLLDSRLYLAGKCIVGIADPQIMKELDVLPKHLDGIVNQLRITRGVEVAVFLYEIGEETSGTGTEEGAFEGYKISMRSNGLVDVAKIAVKFNGGGHIKAAGATIYDTKENIVKKICNEIQNQLNGVL